MKTISLPALVPLDWCLEGFDLPWFPGEEVPDEPLRLVADRPLTYVDPVACTVLAAWANSRIANGRTLVLDDSVKSPYAWRIGLLSALAGRTWAVDAASDRTLPVTRLGKQADIEPLLVRVRGMIKGALTPALAQQVDDTSDAIVYCFSELLRNVFEHSASPLGAFVAASYFPKADRVTISVADLGVTIPHHIRRRFAPEGEKAPDDEVALRVALEPRASGSDDPNRNAGLGLYMTRRIADLTGGKFWLLTSGVCARNDGNSSEIGGNAEVAIKQIENRWSGTVVAISLFPRRLGNFKQTIRLADAEVSAGNLATTKEMFPRKAIPQGFTVVQVPPDASNIAQDKVAAQALRQTVVMPALRDSQPVCFSFSRVALTTQSFIHALLAEPLRFVGIERVSASFRFQGCSAQVQEVIRMVIGYVLERAPP